MNHSLDKQGKKVPRTGLAVVAALLAAFATSAHAEMCADFRGQIEHLDGLKENTRGPEYIEAARQLAATRKAAIESVPEPLAAADLEAIVAAGKAATSTIGNRNASDSFLEAALLVFQGVRSEIDSGRFMRGERGRVLSEMIVLAGTMARESLNAANKAQHDAGIAFHRTIYAAVCG